MPCAATLVRCAVGRRNPAHGCPPCPPNPRRDALPPAGVARIYDRSGGQTAEVQLESRAQCLCLDWDQTGEVRRTPFAARVAANST